VEGARTLNAGKGMQSINLQRAMWSVTEKVADLLKLMPFFCRLCFLTQSIFVCCSCVLGKKVIKNTEPTFEIEFKLYEFVNTSIFVLF
jgi:hypothetical protein